MTHIQYNSVTNRGGSVKQYNSSNSAREVQGAWNLLFLPLFAAALLLSTGARQFPPPPQLP